MSEIVIRTQENQEAVAELVVQRFGIFRVSHPILTA